MGCAPYLQIFKAGKLIHTSAASLHVQQSDEELPFVQVMDGTVPFNINQIIQGDILIRCRHLTFEKKRVSMFRAAFHTGYAPPNVLRLTKTELDGACADKRYPDDFFLDLIFEKVDADALARHDEENESGEEESKSGGDGDAGDGTDEKRKGPVLKASNFDSMLQGDSRFWDVIASAKKETEEKHKNIDAAPTKERTQLETFSIGNEFDFLPVADNKKINAKKKSPKRDSLMDALNALDEDEGPNPDVAEEIVFDFVDSSAKKSSEATKPIFDDTDVAIVDGDKETESENIEERSKNTDATTPQENSTQADQQDEILEDEDDDMDALLASADDDEDFGDLDLTDFDDDDDLEDLENMLKAS
ncbi:MAG: hypothetical protein ACI90V_003512 [Bacillariaceae sp.]|jgi:hypothetical protein